MIYVHKIAYVSPLYQFLPSTNFNKFSKFRLFLSTNEQTRFVLIHSDVLKFVLLCSVVFRIILILSDSFWFFLILSDSFWFFPIHADSFRFMLILSDCLLFSDSFWFFDSFFSFVFFLWFILILSDCFWLVLVGSKFVLIFKIFGKKPTWNYSNSVLFYLLFVGEEGTSKDLHS